MNPTIRTFSRAIDTKLPEDGALPQNMRPWWGETRENFDRLVDRVGDLEQGETAPATSRATASVTSDNVTQLFDESSEVYSQASIDFLSALHD
jgi:hypothetical protein